MPDADAIAAFRDRPGVWLSFAGSAFLIAYSERLRPLQLKPSWVTTLAIVAEHPGITQAALGRALRINRASSMALATLLENAGYVSRTAAAGRRRTALALTTLGRTRLVEACEVEERLVAALFGSVRDDQLTGFADILRRITRAANAIGQE